MPTAIDLNADLGEGFPWDQDLLRRVTSANVCCGAHAGDPDAIASTLGAAKRLGVVAGAHPGYPDREHFGRRDRAIGREQVTRLILGQVAELASIADPVGVPIRYLKPHGALYNQAQNCAEIAVGVVEAAKELGLPVLGMPGGLVEVESIRLGVRFVAEGFADRRYRPDGRLVPRSQPDAMLDDPDAIGPQIVRLIGAGIETLCLHGDDPSAVARADLVLGAIRDLGVEIRSFAARPRGC